MSIVRKNLEEIIKGVQENRIMDIFEKYYHDDVIMVERGYVRVGKEEGRKFEQGFVDSTIFHEVKLLYIMVDGNNSAYKTSMKLSENGRHYVKEQWYVQEWKDGKVIREEF